MEDLLSMEIFYNHLPTSDEFYRKKYHEHDPRDNEK